MSQIRGTQVLGGKSTDTQMDISMQPSNQDYC